MGGSKRNGKSRKERTVDQARGDPRDGVLGGDDGPAARDDPMGVEASSTSTAHFAIHTPRTEGDQDLDIPPTFTDSQLAEAAVRGGQPFEDFKKSAIEEFTQAAMAALATRLPEEKFNEQIRRLRDDMSRQDAKIATVGDQFSELNHRLSRLEQELDLARAKPREASVADALQEWLGAANLQLGEHAELLGDDLSRRSCSSAQALAAGVRSQLRRAPSMVAVCVSVDKNRKEVAMEMAPRKLRKGVLDHWGIHVQVSSGSRIPKVEWNLVALADSQHTREEATSLVQWLFCDKEITWNMTELVSEGFSHWDASSGSIRCVFFRGFLGGPWPDGLHYAAWRTGLRPVVLYEVLQWIARGNLMDSSFAAMVAAFAPEPLEAGPGEDDLQGLQMAAFETRPLGWLQMAIETPRLPRPVKAALKVLPYSRLRAALLAVDASWADFTFASSVAHLGFQVGPGASRADQWRAPLAKHLLRATEISRRGAPSGAVEELHRTRALPVLSSAAELAPLGWQEARGQRALIARLPRAPCTMLLALARWNGPRFDSMYAMTAAALMRSALSTCSTWRGGPRFLRAQVQDSSTMDLWSRSRGDRRSASRQRPAKAEAKELSSKIEGPNDKHCYRAFCELTKPNGTKVSAAGPWQGDRRSAQRDEDDLKKAFEKGGQEGPLRAEVQALPAAPRAVSRAHRLSGAGWARGAVALGGRRRRRRRRQSRFEEHRGLASECMTHRARAWSARRRAR
ncbi:unnamed protein product [Prorocentrum cordatum]|uniref:Uncharacterized protein n=1 Tax=Prorocentrum cordatum TaxID=2364126 RepID=A0ABN9VIT2_9DINO|nr:unnamed protein product [Polarella glacialis]